MDVELSDDTACGIVLCDVMKVFAQPLTKSPLDVTSCCDQCIVHNIYCK